MRTTTVVVAVGVLASVASADDRRIVAVNGHAGVATPFGFGGVAAEATPLPALSVEAGVGKGLSGVQLALHPRLRVITVECCQAYSIGLGASVGRYERRDPWWGIEYLPTVFDTAVWGNLDVGFELRIPHGVQFRMYVGLSVLAYGHVLSCADRNGPRMDCPSTDRGTILPYVGVSGGFGN